MRWVYDQVSQIVYCIVDITGYKQLRGQKLLLQMSIQVRPAKPGPNFELGPWVRSKKLVTAVCKNARCTDVSDHSDAAGTYI